MGTWGAGPFDNDDAAAALVAAQCPGGTPVCTEHDPEQPLPPLVDLRPLAARTVARALGPDSDLTEGWFAYAAHPARRGESERLRAVLREPEPLPPGQDALLLKQAARQCTFARRSSTSSARTAIR
ncbi:DUF4259 domain-containing protein [Kitasatospora phosalacinea]|uniref:DUF4259 domain-containing protein n=1 Tax=Kitasatospora phosalacinea TaxID=2065 RepID=UPI0005278E7E|nr:DUF4259 domain-containing protein [Kitasatospora phosalacinea]